MIESYFGRYRGKYPFIFFNQDDNQNLKDRILSYLKYPYGEGKYSFNLHPIMAICSLKANSSSEASCLNTLVFCEEGIAFEYAREFKVIKYEKVVTVYRKTKKSFFSNDCRVFLLRSMGEPNVHYVLEDAFSAGVDLSSCTEKEQTVISEMLYDFIKLFNVDCKYISK